MLYPLTDEGPKRPRSFQCRESLWQQFEDIASRENVPIDSLVEDAMVAYAKKRGNLEAPTAPSAKKANLDETQDAAALIPNYGQRAQPNEVPRTQRMPGSPQKLPAPVPPGPGPGRLPPPARPSNRSLPAPPQTGPLARPPPAMPSRPPPLPPGGIGPSMPSGSYAAPSTRTLRLMYQGRPYVVDKDRFLIGRSKAQADLRVDDSNVSRQHAMVERVGDAWYIVDLGSTNGVTIGGQRVARRALRDGDVLEITTHQIVVSIG